MAVKKSIKKGGASSPMSEAAKKIKEYLSKEGVIIIIDSDPNSDSARMGTPYTYEQKRGVLKIITPNLEDFDGKELILEAIRETHKLGHLIYKESKISDIKSYKDYVSSKSNNDILKFFDGIIPLDDFFALKTSLFIEYLDGKGVNIYYHKKDLRDRFGPRGTNIANLCSANYFRDVFKPLYNESSKKDFEAYYELAVGKRAIALFVNSHMNVDGIHDEVSKMVSKAVNYGLDDFHVHGKGTINVANIKQFVKQIDSEIDGYIAIKEYEDKKLNVIEFIIELV